MDPFSENTDDLINTIASICQERKLPGLVSLLAEADFSLEITDYDNWDAGIELYTLYMQIPPSRYAEITDHIEITQNTILEIAQSVLLPYRGSYLKNVTISPKIVTETKWREVARYSATQELVHLIEAQKNLMVSVSTGGPRINDVNSDYMNCRATIKELLSERGITNPNPFDDLWGWYGKYSTDLPRYQDRRTYLTDLFSPIINRLREPEALALSSRFVEPTGWERVDVSIGEIRSKLFSSILEEDYQTIGLSCREVIISVAQLLFDPDHHKTIDGVKPSSTDAKRMLEAYIDSEFSGASYKLLRKCVKASYDLVNELQHKRTADFTSAAFTFEATISTVNLLAIISGKKSREA